MAETQAGVSKIDVGDEEITWIEQAVAERFRGSAEISILEAGCGRAWPLNLGDLHYKLTGLDLSQEALEHRVSVIKDLEVPILGDLRSADLPSDAFDVVYCAYVLEHIEGADKVLVNLDKWTAPGGLIILRLPDRSTVYGAMVRRTPYRSHVWFYRHVFKETLAGTEGRPPFPTVYERSIAPNELRRFFTERGYAIVGERICRPFPYQQGWVFAVARVFMRVASWLTLGRLAGDHNNYAVIVRKPDGA